MFADKVSGTRAPVPEFIWDQVEQAIPPKKKGFGWTWPLWLGAGLLVLGLGTFTAINFLSDDPSSDTPILSVVPSTDLEQDGDANPENASSGLAEDVTSSAATPNTDQGTTDYIPEQQTVQSAVAIAPSPSVSSSENEGNSTPNSSVSSAKDEKQDASDQQKQRLNSGEQLVGNNADLEENQPDPIVADQNEQTQENTPSQKDVTDQGVTFVADASENDQIEKDNANSPQHDQSDNPTTNFLKEATETIPSIAPSASSADESEQTASDSSNDKREIDASIANSSTDADDSDNTILDSRTSDRLTGEAPDDATTDAPAEEDTAVDATPEPIVDAEPSAESASTAMDEQPKPEQVLDLNLPDPNRAQWFITAFGGPNGAYRRLNSDVHSELVDHKNESEKLTLAYDLGLVLTRRKGRLELGAGLYYTLKGEEYDFRTPDISHTTKNTYSYLGLPISVGYTLFNAGKFQFKPRLEVIPFMLADAQASWLDPFTHDAVLKEQRVNEPYRQFALGGRINVEASWEASNRVSLFVRPGYSSFLTSIYRKEEGLQQTPYSFDLDFGVNFRLSR